MVVVSVCVCLTVWVCLVVVVEVVIVVVVVVWLCVVVMCVWCGSCVFVCKGCFPFISVFMHVHVSLTFWKQTLFALTRPVCAL